MGSGAISSISGSMAFEGLDLRLATYFFGAVEVLPKSSMSPLGWALLFIFENISVSLRCWNLSSFAATLLKSHSG